MKRFFPIVLLSIALHCLAVTAVFFLMRPDARRPGPLSVELIPGSAAESGSPGKPSLQGSPAGGSPEEVSPAARPALPAAGKGPAGNEMIKGEGTAGRPHTDPAWNAFAGEVEKKRLFMSKEAGPSQKDSLMQARFRRFIEDASVYSDPGRAQSDGVEDDIRKRNLGTETSALPSEVIRSLAEQMRPPPPEARFTFIPSPVEAGALACLFHKNKATQLDIYASLDTGLVCTAEKLDEALEHLVEQGFIRRRKISPESILTLASPFGSLPLELSKTNRLNPLYLYEPHIEQRHLMHYLQSRLDRLHRSSAAGDSTRIAAEIRRIHTVMQLLVQDPSG